MGFSISGMGFSRVTFENFTISCALTPPSLPIIWTAAGLPSPIETHHTHAAAKDLFKNGQTVCLRT